MKSSSVCSPIDHEQVHKRLRWPLVKHTLCCWLGRSAMLQQAAFGSVQLDRINVRHTLSQSLYLTQPALLIAFRNLNSIWQSLHQVQGQYHLQHFDVMKQVNHVKGMHMLISWLICWDHLKWLIGNNMLSLSSASKLGHVSASGDILIACVYISDLKNEWMVDCSLWRPFCYCVRTKNYYYRNSFPVKSMIWLHHLYAAFSFLISIILLPSMCCLCLSLINGSFFFFSFFSSFKYHFSLEGDALKYARKVARSSSVFW